MTTDFSKTDKKSSEKNSNSNLLPVGFYDLIFDEAEKNHQLTSQALDSFMRSGYRLIKTPLLEFAENFLSKNSQNFFTTTDKISGKNLVLRSDITLQIERLLNSRLKNQHLPLRICYVGDVLLAENKEFYADRQQTQLGLEIIGATQENFDLEVIGNLLAALDKTGLEGFVVVISLPDFLDDFLQEICEDSNSELRLAIITKNLSKISELNDNKSGLIRKIILGELSLSDLKKLFKNQKLLSAIEKSEKIGEFIAKNFPKFGLDFDLFGDDSAGYHHGCAFDIFFKNFPYPLARGGRYKIKQYSAAKNSATQKEEIKTIEAIGATIYINFLRKISLTPIS